MSVMKGRLIRQTGSIIVEAGGKNLVEFDILFVSSGSVEPYCYHGEYFFAERVNPALVVRS